MAPYLRSSSERTADRMSPSIPSPEIKSIPTVYNGFTFRSRLEARWAVFLDGISLRWEYEPEGYQLPSGWYLPDFWLPDRGVFVEVKSENGRTAAARKKCFELCDATGSPVVITGGVPDEYDYDRALSRPTCEIIVTDYEGDMRVFPCLWSYSGWTSDYLPVSGIWPLPARDTPYGWSPAQDFIVPLTGDKENDIGWRVAGEFTDQHAKEARTRKFWDPKE